MPSVFSFTPRNRQGTSANLSERSLRLAIRRSKLARKSTLTSDPEQHTSTPDPEQESTPLPDPEQESTPLPDPEQKSTLIPDPEQELATPLPDPEQESTSIPDPEQELTPLPGLEQELTPLFDTDQQPTLLEISTQTVEQIPCALVQQVPVCYIPASIGTSHHGVCDIIRNNDEATKFYTGLPTYELFQHLLSFLAPAYQKTFSTHLNAHGIDPKISLEDGLLLVLMRLRVNAHLEDLSY